MKLKEISLPIHEDLKIFDAHFKKVMRGKGGLVDTVARYIARQKGKKIRPTLVFLSAKLTGDVNERTISAATLVEILHTATLVHDDVVDQSDIRRGFPSVNKIWKNKVAVLMGDYFLARGLLVALDRDEYYFLKIISDAVKRMAEGEILQIQKSKTFDITEDTYFRIISDKTASLIGTCCELGAASVTPDQNTWKILRNFGENLGIAFQIRDDMLDYIGRSSITGKPTGADMREKKFTLPLIYALRESDKKNKRNIIRMIKNGASRSDINYVIDFVRQNGGLEYAVSKASEYAQTARGYLESFPGSPVRESMEMLIEFAVSRTK